MWPDIADAGAEAAGEAVGRETLPLDEAVGACEAATALAAPVIIKTGPEKRYIDMITNPGKYSTKQCDQITKEYEDAKKKANKLRAD